MEFADSREANPINPPLSMVINFLYSLYDKGVKYSGIGTARSAISSFVNICSGGKIDIGNSVLVKKFMKGVFNKRPALPKYSSTWNPDIVLSYLTLLGSNITLLQLSQKVCMLLLLLTGQRGQSIHLLKLSDICINDTGIEIQFSNILKHTKPGRHQGPIMLKAFVENRSICIVSCLREYIKRTEALRGTENRLFITTQPPFKAVARATISRWTRTIMRKAGLNVDQFKPHSTRAAATSAAKDKGIPLHCIM
ncbi:MAG: tyrosine-type recombinase/integrase, partial [Candidatus Thiodiazotropha sp.]